MEGSKFSVKELTELIKARRTIFPKNYTDREVHRDVLEEILNNAIWAPTHAMTQPWRFKVFKGDARKELSEKLCSIYERITPNEKFLQRKFDKYRDQPLQSSVVIAVCMEPGSNKKIQEIDEIAAVACAVQNMGLTATAFGLGTFWSTGAVVFSNELKEYLGLSEKGKCLGLFYLGYPSIEWPKGSRKTLEQFTEWFGS